MLQQMTPCERVTFLMQEGHVCIVCEPGLFLMSQASVSSVKRPIGSVNLPPTSPQRMGDLPKKTTGVRPLLEKRAGVAGGSLSSLSIWTSPVFWIRHTTTACICCYIRSNGIHIYICRLDKLSPNSICQDFTQAQFHLKRSSVFVSNTSVSQLNSCRSK